MSVSHPVSYLFSKSRIAFVAALLLSTGWCHAATYIVGTGGGCTHGTIQSAIAAAEGNPGADTIRVTRSLSYGQQALVISTSQALDITGGYATCAQFNRDGNLTTIDGAGGSTEPVFRITVNSGGVVNLTFLKVTGGDEDGAGYGGGIYFRGNGILEFNDSTITANTAGYGGGIYAEGIASSAELIIGSNVQIVGNTARYSGGGVYVDSLEMTMIAPNSYIAVNHAPGVFNSQTNTYSGGYAGGLMVLSGSLPAYAYVGSSGIGASGPIYFNDARYGGGVAVISHDTKAELQLFTTDPASPVRIKSNSAVVAGGGIFERSEGSNYPYVKAWYASIEDNGAPRGAAIYMGEAGQLRFNVDPLPAGAVACPNDRPCGEISYNYAEDDSGTATGGVIEVSPFSFPLFNRISINQNQGRNVFRGDGNGVEFGGLGFETHHVLIARNVVSEQLIATVNDDNHNGYFDLRDTTIAGNTIGASSVMRISNACQDPVNCGTFYRTIIWQPGKTTLQFTGGYPFSYLTDIVSEVGSLSGSAPEAIVAEPRFVDPARGDFSLRAASPAIDAATTVASDPLDMFSEPRDVDLDLVENSRGPRDIGAIERQGILPLVLNGDFDADPNLWTVVTPVVSSWDGTQNSSGAANSGSIKVTQVGTSNQTHVYGLSQCIHLPGPGIYALNGYGRSGTGTAGNRDYLYLNWEYRSFGGEQCDGGAANASGDHFLSNSSSWQRPMNPKLINVPASEWTYTSSIKITLVVTESGTTAPPTTIGWFDGITLEWIDPNDRIFDDGFETPM